jgi:hypothetical protein
MFCPGEWNALLLESRLPFSPGLLVVVGLSVFGFVFAVISSLHSYLILADAGSKKAAQDVGFYYAANAAGRLFGIVLSGALAQYGGLPACLRGLGRDARNLPHPDPYAPGRFSAAGGARRRLNAWPRHIPIFRSTA